MSDRPVITDAVLDQWEGSAEQDAERDQPWSTNPRAILAVIAELRERRSSSLVLTPMERDMLVAICEEGIEDWNDQTAVGLRAKVLALAPDVAAGGGPGR
jgi:hypothetical protein